MVGAAGKQAARSEPAWPCKPVGVGTVRHALAMHDGPEATYDTPRQPGRSMSYMTHSELDAPLRHTLSIESAIDRAPR